jgi:hypothetical protein
VLTELKKPNDEVDSILSTFRKKHLSEVGVRWPLVASRRWARTWLRLWSWLHSCSRTQCRSSRDSSPELHSAREHDRKHGISTDTQ